VEELAEWVIFSNGLLHRNPLPEMATFSRAARPELEQSTTISQSRSLSISILWIELVYQPIAALCLSLSSPLQHEISWSAGGKLTAQATNSLDSAHTIKPNHCSTATRDFLESANSTHEAPCLASSCFG
jgi:hypothetical protein